MGMRGKLPNKKTIKSKEIVKKAVNNESKDKSRGDYTPRELDLRGNRLYKKLRVILIKESKFNSASKEALAALCMSYSIYLSACDRIKNSDGSLDIVMAVTTKNGSEYFQERPEISIIKKYNKEIRDFCRLFGLMQIEFDENDEEHGDLD